MASAKKKEDELGTAPAPELAAPAKSTSPEAPKVEEKHAPAAKPEKAAVAPPPAVPAAAPAPALATPTAPSVRTYRVWAHGVLIRNGTTYQPGETLTLPEAEAVKIPCLEAA